MEWMLMPLRRYAEFEGRSRRKEYWAFFLLYYVIYFLLLAVMIAGLPWAEMFNDQLVAQSQPGEAPEISPLIWVGAILWALFLIATLLPSIAVTVRRFHDLNLSGWMYLLNFIPYIGWLIVIVFMCFDGKRGPSQYGDDPKDIGTASVFE